MGSAASIPSSIPSRKVRTMVSIGIVGAGQFSGQFARLFAVHPDIDRVVVTELAHLAVKDTVVEFVPKANAADTHGMSGSPAGDAADRVGGILHRRVARGLLPVLS